MRLCSPSALMSIYPVARTMDIFDLGIKAYEYALSFQEELLVKRISGEAGDALILVEHPAVVTLGRLSEEYSIPGKSYFDANGIEVLRTGRGGKATFHSPGQLVMYPVISLADRKKDIAYYIDFLEKTVTRSLNELGVPACRKDGNRGVWAGDRKVAFTGIAIKQWVTYHGVAVNINNDTSAFEHLHPCGDPGIKVTSAREILGRELEMSMVKTVFSSRFQIDLDAEYARPRRAVSA